MCELNVELCKLFRLKYNECICDIMQYNECMCHPFDKGIKYGINGALLCNFVHCVFLIWQIRLIY